MRSRTFVLQFCYYLTAQIQAPFGISLPISFTDADSILQSQGFVKKEQEHLTYLPGLIAYVIMYKSEKALIILNGTPETKTIYSEAVSYLGEGDRKYYFKKILDENSNKYGKPAKYTVDESYISSSYEAIWFVDNGEININGWLDTYSLSHDICKKEQPKGIPLKENGERLKCY